MVRRRVEIKKIEDKAKRQTTFTKRRQGLFKKAEELGKKCDVDLAVITFSKAGNLYATGHPSVNTVINRYMRNNAPAEGQPGETSEISQAIQAETSGKDESNLLPLPTEKKYTNEVEQILAEIEEIKSKISCMPAEASKLHGLDKTIAELEDMKGTMEVLKARAFKPNQG